MSNILGSSTEPSESILAKFWRTLTDGLVMETLGFGFDFGLEPVELSYGAVTSIYWLSSPRPVSLPSDKMFSISLSKDGFLFVRYGV